MFLFSLTFCGQKVTKRHINCATIIRGTLTFFSVSLYQKEKTKVIVGTKIFLKTNGQEYKMVDMSGWSTNEAIRFCNMIGLSYTLNGYGTVKSFSIPKDTVITPDMNLEITLEP